MDHRSGVEPNASLGNVVPTGELRDGVQAWRVMDHENETHERARVIFEPSRDHSPFAITGTSFLHRSELLAVRAAIDKALGASENG